MSDGAVLVYDGDCPFCSSYSKMVRFRDAVGHVTLINARDGGDVVDQLQSSGYDLDDGMVLILDGQIYHGSECINRLALLSSGSGVFNRVNRAIFRSSGMSRGLYPILRLGRNTTLRILGRTPIGDGPRKGGGA